AVTATDTKGKSAGVENLFMLLKEFGQPAQYEYLEKERKKGTIKFSELKDVLADEIANYFAPFRERREKLLDSPELLADALAIGAAKARQRAQETLREVKEKIGLL
ncbi:tryptophan--tRNA ligase, partial [Patescibacteria group bacterium]|nr:tryptophan--tRNA ligase [Patescibacteria group bacterium]